MKTRRNVLVLGGSGFVGRHVTQKLVDSGHQVRSVSRRDGDLDLRRPEHFHALLDQVPNVEVIVNCAAHVGSLVYVTDQAATVVDDNMRLLLSMYRVIAERRTRVAILNPVANCAFPGDLARYCEGDLWKGPLHPSVMSYGSTRRMMLVLSDCYRMQHDIRSVNLFVPNMYGPFESTDPTKAHALSALVSKVVKARREGLPSIQVWGTGVAVREWLFAPDFARVVDEILRRGEDGFVESALNIGQSSGLSVRALLEIIVDVTGYAGEIVWDRTKPDGAPVKVMDDVRFRQKFPEFVFTPLQDGIAKTAAYYDSVYPY